MSGIEELVWVDPKSLNDNPLNWRTHPQKQREAFSALKSYVGWADALTYNRTTQRLIDGHMRKSEAIKAGETSVPVLIGSWTEEEERELLKSFDPLGSLAKTNDEALLSLTEGFKRDISSLESISTKHKKILTDLNESLITFGKKRKRNYEENAGFESQFPDQKKVKEFNEEVFFKSTNSWGIPDLLEDCLIRERDIPVRTFNRTTPTYDTPRFYNLWHCESSRPFPPERSGGILGFFTEDWRFEKYYEKPDKWLNTLLQENWSGVMMPDFSLYNDWPFAMNLWNLYRSRWCARYWQEQGIKILPIIQVCGWKSHSIGIETLPKGMDVVAVECRTLTHNKGSFISFATTLTHAIEVLRSKNVIIYGGLEHQKKFWGRIPKESSKLKYIFLPSFIEARRNGNKNT